MSSYILELQIFGERLDTQNDATEGENDTYSKSSIFWLSALTF